MASHHDASHTVAYDDQTVYARVHHRLQNDGPVYGTHAEQPTDMMRN